MGWLFKNGYSRKEMIEERAKSWEATIRRNAGQIHLPCSLLPGRHLLGHVVGSLGTHFHSGWTNRSTSRTMDHLRPAAIPKRFWMGLQRSRRKHASRTTILVRFLTLDLVPIDQYGGNSQWREGVRKYHALQAEKRRNDLPDRLHHHKEKAMPQYKVEALEKFVVRTVYNVDAKSRKQAETYARWVWLLTTRKASRKVPRNGLKLFLSKSATKDTLMGRNFYKEFTMKFQTPNCPMYVGK